MMLTNIVNVVPISLAPNDEVSLKAGWMLYNTSTREDVGAAVAHLNFAQGGEFGMRIFAK